MAKINILDIRGSRESSHKIWRTEFRNFYSEFSFVNLYFEFWTCLAFEKYYHHIVIFTDQPSYQGPIQIPIFSVAEEFWREEKRREVNHPEIEEKMTSKKSAIKSVPQCRAPLSCGLHRPSFWIFFSCTSCISCNNPTVD